MAELAPAWVLIDPRIYESEESVSGPIYHIGGFVHQNDLISGWAVEYARIRFGAATLELPSGSVAADDDNLKRMLRDFATASLSGVRGVE
jgi:hypothetical protein